MITGRAASKSRSPPRTRRHAGMGSTRFSSPMQTSSASIQRSPPKKLSTKTTSNDIQVVEELESQLFHLQEELKLKKEIAIKVDVGATSQREQVERGKEKLRQMDIQRQTEQQRGTNVKDRLSDKVLGVEAAIQRVHEEEAVFKATHEQRKKTHGDCVLSLRQQRVTLRDQLAACEVNEKHCSYLLELADEANATVASQRRQRAQSRAERESHERAEDSANFSRTHVEIFRLRTLNNIAEIDFAKSELRLAESQLRDAQVAVDQSVVAVETRHRECEDASRELLGISTIQANLRSIVAKAEALEGVVAQTEVEINQKRVEYDTLHRQYAVGETDFQLERDSDARIKELVRALDAMREKLMVSRERRDNNRIHFRSTKDIDIDLRAAVERGSHELEQEKINMKSLLASRNNELEMLAAQVNQTTVRLNEAELKLQEADAQHHAALAALEQARAQDQKIREAQKRSAVELQRALQQASGSA